MLNLCNRQQSKLYVQIFATNYIPSNIRSCHALDTNAALKENNHFFLMVLVAQAIQAKWIIVSDKSLIRLSILQELASSILQDQKELNSHEAVRIRYH